MTGPAMTPGYRAMTQGAGLVDRAGAVLGVTGPDAGEFLDGQLSVAASKIEVGAGAEALLLSPQGRLVAVGLLLRSGTDDFLYLLDRRTFDAAAERLVQFHVRVDCDVYGDDELGLWAVIGPGADDAVRAAFGVDPPPDAAPLAHLSMPGHDDWRLVREPAEGLGGILAVCSREHPEVPGAVDVDPVSLDARRIEAGSARFGIDYDESTVPQEAGLVPRAVDLDKGCYVGQELIERIYSRGHTNRSVRRVRLEGDSVPSPGALVVDSAGKEVGSLTTTAWCPSWDAPGGLGLLRRELQPDSTVAVGAAALPGVVIDE